MTSDRESRSLGAAILLRPLPELPVRLARLQAFVFRAVIATPVRTSFGVMHDRPSVFVRAEDADGCVGWGEAWCNFPSCAAEHRANIIQTVIAPLVVNKSFVSIAEAFAEMTRRTSVLALQAGEPGPIAQSISGVDLALWDLVARRTGKPLWRLLGGGSGTISVYASGINPERAAVTVAAKAAEGHRAFKLKIGFDDDRDIDNVRAVRAQLGTDASLMVDANQAWSLVDAQRMAQALEPFDLGWLEEPLRADAPSASWQSLRDATRVPLAAGENLIGEGSFLGAIDGGALSVVQPDAAKWGGISGCWRVIQMIHRAGQRYCPHYLGGGVGLLASAHLLAAAGGDGMLEIDSNENPLRSELSAAIERIDAGKVDLGTAPGLGVSVDPTRLRELCAVP
jgi:D-galactarolactone cycloisomerase